MKKVGIIFGGMSTEHDVSVASANSVLKNINKQKYEIYPIYIDQKGNWHEYLDKVENIEVGYKVKNTNKIENIIEYLKKLEVVFPVMHGKYGEDGSLQGLLEMIKIPYVGCKVLASSIGMDKVYTKVVFEKARNKASKILLY